jgi:Dihydroorotase and related cyclic amidohydrolases
MKSSLTIRNADVVLPENVQKTDVSVINGVINAIGSEIPEVGEIIDAEGLILIPGIIDPQVHFREPGADHKEDLHSGSCAAAAGGVTSFLDMPNNNPPVTTIKRMAEKKQLAAEKSVVNYGFFIGATPDNLKELNAVEMSAG